MSYTLKISNGDIDINPVTGNVTLLSGVEKCAQDVANVLMIDRVQPTNNRAAQEFAQPYGNELATLRVPTRYGDMLGRPLVAQKIQEAIQSLMDLQARDPTVTDDEAIDRIDRLIVESISATDYIYYLEVVVRSGVTVPAVTNLKAVRLDHQFAFSSGETQSS